MRARLGGAIAGISVGLLSPGCLDDNPEFVEPPLPTSGASDSATSTTSPTTSPTTGTWTTGASTTSGTSGSVDSDSDSTTTTSSTDTTATTDPSTGVQSVCGDGVAEGGEECDNGLGNADDADCTLDCLFNVCGDGKLHISNEMCDDANDDPADGCINCLNPASCADVQGLAPMAPTGEYVVDLDGPGLGPEIPVYCDMDLAGGGWTLIERSPYADPIGVALYKDWPVNLGDPTNQQFRLPKMVISTLSSLSTEAWLGCGGMMGDHLLFAPFELFKGEFGPQDCSAADKVLYKEAVLKGHKLMDVELCTGFWGTNDGECPGAWRVDEYEQSQPCQLPNFPWFFMEYVTSDGADAFAVDPWTSDTLQPIHDCHLPGASRVILFR